MFKNQSGLSCTKYIIQYIQLNLRTKDTLSVEVAVRRYIGYSTVTLVTVVGKSVYIQLHRVTYGYIELQVVTYSYIRFHRVT